jgi:hypothetical protein
LKKPSIGKEYFKHMNLEAIVTNYPYRKNLPKEDIAKGQLLEKAGNFYSTCFVCMTVCLVSIFNSSATDKCCLN